jgi:ATP-binding cassette subfamily B protein
VITRDLDDLPQGSTRVGERGITLSGGQRQRVALARALLLDPASWPDDSLSSVDADTEEAIPAACGLHEEPHHLPDLAPRLDCHGGRSDRGARRRARVAESGTVRDLLAADGLFAALHRRQQLEREVDAL